MKISARLTGTADLARLDLTRLRDRLTTDLARDLQMEDEAQDVELRRTVSRLAAPRFSSPSRGEGGAP